MIVTLLYHRVGEGKYATPLERLKDHFEWISSNHPTLFVGEKPAQRKALSLTFDDATYDFYSDIFPLLCRYGLKATLFVPTGHILDACQEAPGKRLPQKDPFGHPEQFCSFEELQKMQASGLVKIGSHSHTHSNLTTLSREELREELLLSKSILEKKLDTPVDALAFPFGKFNRSVLAESKEHYRYLLRIGGAVNYSWQPLNYRIVADNLPSKNFSPTMTHRLNHILHRLRCR